MEVPALPRNRRRLGDESEYTRLDNSSHDCVVAQVQDRRQGEPGVGPGIQTRQEEPGRFVLRRQPLLLLGLEPKSHWSSELHGYGSAGMIEHFDLKDPLHRTSRADQGHLSDGKGLIAELKRSVDGSNFEIQGDAILGVGFTAHDWGKG